MMNEIVLSNELIRKARDKKYKTNKEYEVIIDLSYLVVLLSKNEETEQGIYILEKLRAGYYDIAADKEKVEELKLSDDNMQYCFF